jgi:signal transduction histidine kinase/CheY-like chemotaxis protein
MKTLIIRLLKKNPFRNNNPIWISFIILIAGLFITVIISNYVKQKEESQAQKEFVQVCNEIKSKIITRINMQKEFLISGSSLFEASETVTRDEWKNFNKFSGNNVKFMGVQGLGFSAIIKKEDLKKHISTIQKEGFPEYKVFPPGIRDSYTSIIYLEPFIGRNTLGFGYDMFSDPVRRKAMEISRDKNEPALSGKVFLRMETKKDIQAGTLMYVPVYKNVPINTIAERREAITGWVFSAFRMDDLMKNTLGTRFLYSHKNIHLQIYEDDAIVPKALLFDSHKNKTESVKEKKIRTQILPVVFNNKKWTLVLSQSSGNPFFFSTQIVLISMGGMTISVLLSALSYSLLITKKRAKTIAEQLSLDLLIKNQEYERMNKSLNKNYKKLIESKEKLKQTNVELEKAKIKAEESDKLKSAFLANMSHEIRTPMNGIMGFAELLKSGNLSPEETKNYIEIIEKSGTRLLSIINDIVDISKIEAGQMKVSYSATNIDEQMQYIHTFFEHEAHDKGIQLVLKKSLYDEETIISTDREKLYAILINLVKNAIKYTVKGIIEFGYEKKDNQIEFFVKDTGIGISKDRQIAIFERFIQADFNDKMARQGAGLGLAIAKAYVELLGGKIWVNSEIGKGSEFYFSIPDTIQIEENDLAQKIISIPKEPCEIKNLKILVTEDDNISRMLILKVLEEFGNKILIAQTGAEAVEICQKTPDLDLILMDIQMPQMNGYEATKEIRKFNSTVIILAQTAYALEGDKAKTIAVGCNDYISKPIKKEELSNLLQHYFCKQENLN